jgi:methionyl-tRNA formyltransferase
VVIDRRLSREALAALRADFVVSHDYGYILPADALALVHNRAVNLHISLLPWNRGTYPNVWSFIDDTPKGVTIHYMEEQVDTGDVIAQRELRLLADEESFASSHAKLQEAILEVFAAHWPAIRSGICERVPQGPGGTHHSDADIVPLLPLLPLGWDTPVVDGVSILRRALGR